MSTVTERPKAREQLPAIREPRLPYHPAIEERFGIDKTAWRALVEAIFTNATSTESVLLALAYCRSRKLDVFKRCVHIVPIWNADEKCYYDTIWPGIGELRTTAFRTGEYCGRDETECGPDITRKIGSMEITFPEWMRITVHRLVGGNKAAFVGPRVYWLETYASKKYNDDTPNEMWATRPRGQLEKCAEAAALRTAFPEELGNDQIPEEVEHARTLNGRVAAPQKLEAITEQLTRTTKDELPESSYEPPSVEDTRDDWQKFTDAVAAAKTLAELNLAVEHHGGKDFGSQRNTEALAIVSQREAAIREAKAKK